MEVSVTKSGGGERFALSLIQRWKHLAIDTICINGKVTPAVTTFNCRPRWPPKIKPPFW